MLIGIFDLGLCTGSNRYLLLDGSVVGPVSLVLVVNFDNVIDTGGQLTGCGIPVFTGGNGFHRIPVCIQNLEFPPFGAPVYSILFHTKVTIVCIAEGHRHSRIRFDSDGFDRRIAYPVRIIHCDFFCVQLLGDQTLYHNGAVFASRKGRTLNRLGAGDIRIDPDLPAGEVFSRIGLLDQLDGTGIQRVMEADRSGSAISNRHLFGVVTGTAVHRFDSTVAVPKLLDIVGADFQTGNGDCAVGICYVRTGHQCFTARIGIDSEFPANQIQTVAGCFD